MSVIDLRKIRGSLVVAAFIVGYYIVMQQTFQLLIPQRAAVISTAGEPTRALPLFRVDTARPWVFLTFDVSWGDQVALKAGRALANVGARGTFFVSAPWARTHRQVIEELLKLGHDVASKGSTTREYRQLSSEEIATDLAQSQETLAQIPGTLGNILRTPNGTYSPTVMALVTRKNYSLVLWDVDPWDWKLETVDGISRRICEAVRPGSIVRFRADDSYPLLPNILPTLTQELRKGGFAVLPLRILVYR